MLGGRGFDLAVVLVTTLLAFLPPPAAAQLAISQRAAITDNYGVEVQQDGTERAMFAATNKMAGRERLRFQWSLDFGHANMLTGYTMTIWKLVNQQGNWICRVELHGHQDGHMALRAVARHGVSVEQPTPWVPVDRVHTISVEWHRDLGNNEGEMIFVMDNRVIDEKTGLMTNHVPLLAYYGAPDGSQGLTGWYAFDDVWIDDMSSEWPEKMAVWIEQPYDLGVPPMKVQQ